MMWIAKDIISTVRGEGYVLYIINALPKWQYYFLLEFDVYTIVANLYRGLENRIYLTLTYLIIKHLQVKELKVYLRCIFNSIRYYKY